MKHQIMNPKRQTSYCYLLLIGQVSLQVLGHPKSLDLLLPEDGLQLLVGGEELSVLGVLELVLL